MSERKTILVTGGAGYIGRCTAEILKDRGYQAVLIDNFSTGRRALVGEMTCFDVDLANRKATIDAFQKMGKIHAIIHFAAKALVPESCEKPEEYFRNNIMATLNVAEAAVGCKIAYLVHSSSCSVYGLPQSVPICEDATLGPVSPYGESKRIAEQVLAQFCRHKKLGVINLRYFNPAGSVSDGRFGEAHDPETHLIPNVVNAFLEQKPIPVFGTNYNTPDGTCIRDFVHIEDLVEAHIAAVQHIEVAPQPVEIAINLGGGQGASVKEVIAAAERVLGGKIRTEFQERRPGDPPKLVADLSLAKRLLNWEPKKGLEAMIADHAKWMTGRGKSTRKRPQP